MPIAEIKAIADDLRERRPSPSTTPRTFLSWFDAQRRGPNIVRKIRAQLEEVGIKTSPDFESTWIDGPMTFELIVADGAGSSIDNESEDQHPSATDALNDTPTMSWVSRDATYRVSKLKAANQQIVSISPDGTLAQAVTLLMSGDFSQLPVMVGEREVKGMVTWKSIGRRLGLGKNAGPIREFMEPHHEIRSDFSIFDAIPIIVAHDYVLVRGDANKITGIITSSDLSMQFMALTEPFLLLSEIENLVRNMIADKFTIPEMITACDPGSLNRDISSVADLTFGECIRLLQNESRWAKIGLVVDRGIFCKNLDKIREIRNDVMHFDPDGISDADLAKLRNFTSFLKQLERVN